MMAPPAPAVAAGYADNLPPLAMLRLLPPPPVPGGSEEAADRFVYRESRKGILGKDWRRAQGQLGITSPEYVQAVSCALGAVLAPKTTPATMILLRRAGTDLAKAVFTAKDYYKRPRPFSTDGGKACDPEAAVNGGKGLGFAYPSGHAAVGWLWGLILSDARPERSATLLKFGKDTGDLRIACRVHWASDVTGGRLLATALYQQIADREDYKADLLKAKAELSLAPVPEGCSG
ncbi:phosphatase PAP2 family protein [Sandarakinorhabdus sp.]|uniref:phosphatase PAP2 family protein n=1 Tax=Sandarakinorhabdus sp. TaxID=1916663 RepID=UPI00286DD4FE|nr:phosphatase PAP2 family protein [Sandarakinorhabdus sp.]